MPRKLGQTIAVVGSSNIDMIIQVKRIPGVGETLLGGAFSTDPGGKGANQAVAAARAGARVDFVARVGDDAYGKEAIAGFREYGVNVAHILHDKTTPTGVAMIFVAEDGANSIAVAPGANAKLSPADVKNAADVIRSAGLLMMQLETPVKTVQAAARIAAGAGVAVILNPAPALELPDALLRHVSILTPNEHEAELLTGIQVSDEAAAAKAADVLRSRGVKTVIITLGSRGAFISDKTGNKMVAGFKVKAIDTTAAGDVFNGALAVALVEGMALALAVRFANAAAAISVTRFGASISAPKRKEIDKLLYSSKA